MICALFIREISPLIDLLSNGNDIVCFSVGLKEKYWTKRDALILMNCDDPKYFESDQRLSGYILMRNSAFSRSFFEEALEYASDIRIISDNPNVLGFDNYEGFTENRHDQSIFSLLTKKHNIPCYRDPSRPETSIYSGVEPSLFPQIIVGTRKRHYTTSVWDTLSNYRRRIVRKALSYFR